MYQYCYHFSFFITTQSTQFTHTHKDKGLGSSNSYTPVDPRPLLYTYTHIRASVGLLRQTCPRRSAMSAGTPRPYMRGRVEPTSLEGQPE